MEGERPPALLSFSAFDDDFLEEDEDDDIDLDIYDWTPVYSGRVCESKQ